MNARLILIQTLVPWLSRMAQSPNRDLAAAAAHELALKTRELANIQRKLAESQTTTEDASCEAGIAA